jgi:hypothetical protein
MAELVEDATTRMQPKPDADAKTQSPANSAGRRSSRGGVSSSSNLKNKTHKQKKTCTSEQRISCFGISLFKQF